jgi:GT2 family glycosyltransferase
MTGRLTIGAGVLHYRFWPGVRQTVDGLMAQTRQPDLVLIVDHASRDESCARIRQTYPEFELVELVENRGPTAGMNQLIATLIDRDVDAVLVLPHDLHLAPDALEQLAARLENDARLGAVGPVIGHQRDRERVFYAGGYVDPRTWDLEFRERPERLVDWRGRPPQRADFLELGGILVRVEAARQVGGLPEHFYYLHDDVDYTLRIAARGWRLECVPAAVAWQDLGDPKRQELLAPTPPYLHVRNRLGLLARNAPRRILVRELARTAVWLVRDAVRPRNRNRADLWPRFRGLMDFCRSRWGPPPRGLSGRSDA